MTNREQNIEAMALAQHKPNHCPRTGQHDFSCPHIQALDCVLDTKYRYLEESAIQYDALHQSLTPQQRAILERDERYAVVNRSVLDEFITYADCLRQHLDNEFCVGKQEYKDSDAEFRSFVDRLLASGASQC